jgi:hypothetical protein
MLMRIKLEAHGLPHPGDAEFQLDWMALDAIYNAVPVEMLSSITTKDMATDAWESIKRMCINDERIRKASAQKVRHEYEMLMFHDGECVEDFAMWLDGIVNQLATLGDPEVDEKVVLKYLRIAKPKLSNL